MKKPYLKYKKNKKTIYSSKNKKNLEAIISKRYNVLIGLVIVLNSILLIGLYSIQIVNHTKYVEKKESLVTQLVEGSTAPRGRIYDRNGKLIVDNEPVKTITYKKISGINVSEEVALAYKLADILDVNINKLTSDDLRNFWIINNSDEANGLITDEEWSKLKARELTNADINNLKKERVTEENLNSFDEISKKAALIYALMNTGYYYDTKVLKRGSDISDFEYAYISENLSSLKGVNTELDWDRTYPYGNVFRSILGNVSTTSSGIPYELKDYYLSKGYNLNDRVGLSYLEYQYEDFLRGKKNVYELSNGGILSLLEEGERGNDLYLTIDIELQKSVEEILEEQLLITKNEPNTEFYNRSFVVITDPNTGEILAMAGKQIVWTNDGYKIYDYTPGILTSPVAVGSVVKGASHIVGYNTGALQIGEVRDDSCIKIAATKEKCSWTYLGILNDITALKQSSNTYQFRTAINVGKGYYQYDSPLKIDPEAFDIYRKTFNQFGLGVKTEIDLPVESLGYIGDSTQAGLLLDFSIGQYDTYTPIQLSQYISTIANGGNRMKFNLLKEVHSSVNNEIIYKVEPTVLNRVETEEQYLNRVKLGFREVITGGTGYGYIENYFNAAGKTGTSQSFIDTDSDGKIDKETLTNTFVAYAPYDNPIVTFTVISPDYTHYYNGNSYASAVNKRISYEVSKKFFEIYQ